MEIDFVMLLISDIYFVCQTISNKFGVLRFWKVFACIFSGVSKKVFVFRIIKDSTKYLGTGGYNENESLQRYVSFPPFVRLHVG